MQKKNKLISFLVLEGADRSELSHNSTLHDSKLL